MFDILSIFNSNTEINQMVERHKVLKGEFESIIKLLETEWKHKQVEILERADIVKKGAKSYSISIDTYEDDDFWQLISDLKKCRKFIYMKYDIPPKMSIGDFNRLNSKNKEWANDNLSVFNQINKYPNKIYFSFYY